MNKNETGAIVNHGEGGNDAAARQTAAAGNCTSSDLFGDSDSDDTLLAQGRTTATAVSTGNDAAKMAVQRKKEGRKTAIVTPKTQWALRLIKINHRVATT